MAEAGQDDARNDATPGENAPAPRRKGRALIFAAGGLVLLLGGAAAAYMFVPQVNQTVQGLLGNKPKPDAQTASTGPTFIDLPEMAVTLPNNGHARQMRIRLSLELAKKSADFPPNEILSPRVYDALLTYLRTLREGELDSGLALDRMRADLYRRLTLVLGPGVVSDVLITGLVLA